ncbi:hypothetical protein LCL97_17480 [Seohaeicola saemankumensis]|nr:I78 family peptidase inhibitor [Seohaeicola saemankumensis]MCA0872629.1 hypothetical protein [Seohaeicola saemankumensis]
MKAASLAALIVAAATGAWASDDTCGAQALEPFVGQPLQAASGVVPDDARILPPNSVMTQDHRPERVNVDLDDKDVILRVWCG